MPYVEITIDGEDVLEQLEAGDVVRFYEAEDILNEMSEETIVDGIMSSLDIDPQKIVDGLNKKMDGQG